MGRKMDLGGCKVEMNQSKKTVRFRWTECMKEDLMYALCDDNSVLYILGIQSFLQRGEVNNVVKILGFMVKRAGAKMRQYTGRNRTNAIGLMKNAVKINECWEGPGKTLKQKTMKKAE
jgi:hypothetical protein